MSPTVVYNVICPHRACLLLLPADPYLKTGSFITVFLFLVKN